MSRAGTFFHSFLDGFTMAGFLERLEPPDEVDGLFAPEPEQATVADAVAVAQLPAFEMERQLHNLTTPQLQRMIELLRREERLREFGVAGQHS